MSGLEASRQFWDEKARENPYWYVSSAGPYEGRNLAEFWASGPKIWNDLKSASGYDPKPTDTVVEIGCGVGRLTRAIAPEVGKVFAFDLSAEMLAIARTSVEAGNASFHRAETPALAEIADSSVDAFVAYCVFQHLPDLDVLRAYLKTAARVLKPGGRLDLHDDAADVARLDRVRAADTSMAGRAAIVGWSARALSQRVVRNSSDSSGDRRSIANQNEKSPAARRQAAIFRHALSHDLSEAFQVLTEAWRDAIRVR